MIDIEMPSLSAQMENGTIGKWLIGDGQPVCKGDELVEIETDKATFTKEAEHDGILEIVVSEGETVAVGEVIARIGDRAPRGEAPADAPTDTPEPAERPASANGDAPRPTPLARRAAAVHEVDLAQVSGSGPRGRILKADVFAAAGIEIRPETPATAPAPAPTAAGAAAQLQEPTRLQQIVAQRMTEAARTVPHFQVATEVDMDAALDIRERLKEAAGEHPAPSINDLIVKACALALKEHPLVNGSFTEGRFELHDSIHVGVAVAIDDGLVVVTIPDAAERSLASIAAETRRLTQAARSGRTTPAELSGATFTVSNLGMFGMTQITAVINPPQAAILGVGAARPTVARGEGGEVVDRHLLTLNLSCDHRILNGADGARFLADVRAKLEMPHALAFS